MIIDTENYLNMDTLLLKFVLQKTIIIYKINKKIIIWYSNHTEMKHVPHDSSLLVGSITLLYYTIGLVHESVHRWGPTAPPESGLNGQGQLRGKATGS